MWTVGNDDELLFDGTTWTVRGDTASKIGCTYVRNDTSTMNRSRSNPANHTPTPHSLVNIFHHRVTEFGDIIQRSIELKDR